MRRARPILFAFAGIAAFGCYLPARRATRPGEGLARRVTPHERRENMKLVRRSLFCHWGDAATNVGASDAGEGLRHLENASRSPERSTPSLGRKTKSPQSDGSVNASNKTALNEFIVSRTAKVLFNRRAPGRSGRMDQRMQCGAAISGASGASATSSDEHLLGCNAMDENKMIAA